MKKKIGAVLLVIIISGSFLAMSAAAQTLDTIPPTTTVSLSGPQYGEWWGWPVTVILTAEDNPSGSGVNKIEYCIRWPGEPPGDWTAVEGSSVSFVWNWINEMKLFYRATDNAGNVEVESIETAYIRATSFTPGFNAGAYLPYQHPYEMWGAAYPTHPGGTYPDPQYGDVPMRMLYQNVLHNVWLSNGQGLTTQFSTSITANFYPVSDATNIWVVGLDGEWMDDSPPVEISYVLDGQTFSKTYYPNGWDEAGTGGGLSLWVDKQGQPGDIAVARIDFPQPGTLTQVTVKDVKGEGGASIPVFAITVGKSKPIYKSQTIYLQIDHTSPAIGYTRTPPPNADGWNNTDVTVTFTCTDAESGIKSCPEPVTVTTEGYDQEIIVTAEDNVGNTGSITVHNINIDKTAPTITIYIDDYDLYPWPTPVYLYYSVNDNFWVKQASAYLNGEPASWMQKVQDPGLYEFVVEAQDYAGNTSSKTVNFIIYVPEGGFATGSGSISPDAEGTPVESAASFEFVAKYKKGASSGNLEFKYSDINLESTSIDLLATGGTFAYFEGTGTINGAGTYTFRVIVEDNGEPGVGIDKFDIMIWEGTNTETEPIHKVKNVLSEGNIQVHQK